MDTCVLGILILPRDSGCEGLQDSKYVPAVYILGSGVYLTWEIEVWK